MLKIGICDDEEAFTIALENNLCEYARMEGITLDIDIFYSAETLLTYIRDEGIFDLLFLDIELGEKSGVEAGEIIRSDIRNETMQIVYVSGKEGYAMQLFRIRPMNFLIKPVDMEKVKQIMEEYKRLFGFENRFFSYHIGKSEYKINEQSILYFQSRGKKIYMITQEETKEFYGKLADILEHLNKQIFCPVHKSFVINMRYVFEYGKSRIEMVNGDSIPISQSMRKYVNRRLLGHEESI